MKASRSSLGAWAQEHGVDVRSLRVAAPKLVELVVAPAPVVGPQAPFSLRIGGVERAGDVAGLALGDIDWRDARVAVSGKSRRREWLPPSGARIEFGYPAAGQALHDRPSTVSLVRGGQSTPLLTNVQWQEGELTGYTTSGGVTWSLARWLEGSPATVALSRGSSSPNLVRQRKFGKTTAGQFTSSFDGWGNPLDIEETIPSWSEAFTTNDFPALTSASAPAEQKAIEYLASGDRYSVDGVPYCYEGGTHRLASVGAAVYGYRADGSLAKRVNASGEALTLCNDAQGRLESTVGAGGEVNRIITNFRHQRVAEVWPLNGLREDFRVDAASRLLSEEGVGSLASQFPRPVREYVWLGMHPVAVLDSTEDAAGAVTPKSVTFIHSGHLAEPLSETDESGRVLRQYVFTPFGERRELTPSASAVSFETDNPYTNHSTTVAVPGARAMKLHFTALALASCDSIIISDGYGGPVVAEIPSSVSGDYWTDWLATDTADVELRAKGCGTARGFKLVEALPDWGSSSSQVRTDSTTQPYPAAGQQFRVSLGAGGFVRLSNLNLASCDAVEARTTAGQTVWKWVPLGSYYQVWTPRLVGDVDVGIWGQGCNATEHKFGFTLAEVRSDSGTSRPVSLGLPGQRLRADGTIDNWYRNLDPESGRYLSPEPLLQSPAYVRFVAQGGMSIPTYAYAHNNPLKYIDRTGLLGTDYSGVTRWSEVQSYRNGQAMAVKQASGAGWEGAGLLMEDGSGPTIRIVDSSDLEPGQWAATQVNVVDGVVVVGDILLSRDVLGGDANLVAHILVHEVGHWKFWNSKVGQSMSSDLWGKYLNAAGERSFCNQKSSNLPHEGYSAERSVFGELRLSR